MKRRGEEGEEEERIPRRRLRSSGRLQCIWRNDLLHQALLNILDGMTLVPNYWCMELVELAK